MRNVSKLLLSVAVLALLAIPAQAHEKGDFMLRVGVGSVDPKSTAYSDPVEDVVVKVDRAESVTLTGTYMMTDNWAIDLLAAWPFTHDIRVFSEGELVDFAETKQLPPTLSLQYHFMPDAKFQPYAGLGLNYTKFYDTEVSSEVASQGISVDMDNSTGIAAQLGANVAGNSNWLFNIDVRWIDIESDVTLSDGIDTETFKIEIDPLVYSLNVGYKFF